MRKARQTLITAAGRAMQAYQRSTQAFDDAIGRALRLNPTDLRCLDWLFDRAMTAGDLAAGVGLSTAATTTLIDRLEQRGFVERARDPGDRRRVLVQLTPGGRDRVGRHYGALVIDGAPLFEVMSDEEIARMRDWLVAARELTDRHRARVASEEPAG